MDIITVLCSIGLKIQKTRNFSIKWKEPWTWNPKNPWNRKTDRSRRKEIRNRNLWSPPAVGSSWLRSLCGVPRLRSMTPALIGIFFPVWFEIDGNCENSLLFANRCRIDWVQRRRRKLRSAKICQCPSKLPFQDKPPKKYQWITDEKKRRLLTVRFEEKAENKELGVSKDCLEGQITEESSQLDEIAGSKKSTPYRLQRSKN